jgi:2-amino-4-hydroxy-6-hydroxymethyldihydropteridine diphosphokinase
MALVAICLGSNLGDRAGNLAAMRARVGVVLDPPVVCSSLMETEPLEMAAGMPWFFNQVIAGGFRDGPIRLLSLCKQIELELGRGAKGEKKSRSFDIDILYYGSEIIQTHDLTLPHPAILTRRYCLEGLVRIAAEWVHPVMGKTVRELRETLGDGARRQQVRFV